MLSVNNVQAQSFAPEVLNPFGLDSAYANRPSFADLDNDGDKDMIIGDTLGNNLYYKNSGTATVPSFDPPLTNPFGLTAAPYFNFPYFVDMDNDGDFDVLTGDIYGYLFYYANTGTAASPAFAAPVSLAFSLPLNIGDNTAMLSMADIDNDGDKDLFTGSFSGDFHYFQNNGTASAANFGSDVLNPFSISVPAADTLSVPALCDLDGDGDFDLVSGSYDGDFYYYENTGTVSAPTFAARLVNPFGLTYLANGLSFPELADLDNDGDFDLMSGDYYGAWHYFENNSPLSITPVNVNEIVFSLFPNPATNSITISTSKSFANKICITDVSGKEVGSFVPVSNKTYIDISHYQDGIYLVSVYTQTGIETLKLVKK